MKKNCCCTISQGILKEEAERWELGEREREIGGLKHREDTEGILETDISAVVISEDSAGQREKKRGKGESRDILVSILYCGFVKIRE